nr:MAG TPA: hypothetical protein [Crassvirales sp.]
MRERKESVGASDSPPFSSFSSSYFSFSSLILIFLSYY